MASVPDLDLDPRETLAGLEELVRARRGVEVEDLLLVAHWCDLQSTDPREDPRPDPDLPRPPGSDRLVRLGGAGTPMVRELTLSELGIARGVHTLSARAIAADVLDLRHRLPRTWAVFLAGRADAWLARRVASMTRELTPAAAAVVDAAAAAAIAGQAPGRVLTLVEAKIIEADPEAHQARVEAANRHRFVSLTRTDATGLRHVIARVTAGDAAYVDAVVSRVADLLADLPEHHDAPRDLLRSIAFGWLARPAELLTLLLEHTEPDPEPDPEPAAESEAAAEPDPEPEPEPADQPDAGPAAEPEPADEPVPARALAFPADLLTALRCLDPERLRPRVVLYVHLHQASLDATTLDATTLDATTQGGPGTGVARIEGLGPHGLAQVVELLGHARVVLKPVIDLHDQVSVNAYEHPTRIAERVHLRHPADTFPHASGTGRRVDLDHRVRYHAQSPPDPPDPPTPTTPTGQTGQTGQTGTDNAQPLGRRGHRAKTHLRYSCVALTLGGTLWRTPHGLHRLVDEHGTHPLDQSQADALTGTSHPEAALAHLLIRHRDGNPRP